MAKVDLGSSLTIAEVGEMKTTIAAALESGEAVDISAKDLDQVDGAGIQLLVAMTREAGSREQQLNWKDVPTSLNDAAKLLGLESALGFNAA